MNIKTYKDKKVLIRMWKRTISFAFIRSQISIVLVMIVDHFNTPLEFI